LPPSLSPLSFPILPRGMLRGEFIPSRAILNAESSIGDSDSTSWAAARSERHARCPLARNPRNATRRIARSGGFAAPLSHAPHAPSVGVRPRACPLARISPRWHRRRNAITYSLRVPYASAATGGCCGRRRSRVIDPLTISESTLLRVCARTLAHTRLRVRTHARSRRME